MADRKVGRDKPSGTIGGEALARRTAGLVGRTRDVTGGIVSGGLPPSKLAAVAGLLADLREE